MRFLLAIATAALLGSATAISEMEYLYLFSRFQTSYNKSYTRDEFKHRYSVFKANHDKVVKHNAEGHSWTMALNEYSDLTWEEFKARKVGYKRPVVKSVPRIKRHFTGLSRSTPSSIDWRDYGAVTGVKNQGSCGACWSFSTTGAIEGAVAISSGTLTSLSEQQLMDCSGSYGNDGCNGGMMDYAFEFVIDNGGICAESAYGYTAASGTCQSCTSVAKISSYVDVTADNEDALLAAVAEQPVSVAIEADQDGFQLYSSGVFSGTCGTDLDHGVLVVGYGTDSSSDQDYWIVKNSWGTSWGEDGYIRLLRTGGSTKGQCGIAMEPSYPVV